MWFKNKATRAKEFLLLQIQVLATTYEQIIFKFSFVDALNILVNVVTKSNQYYVCNNPFYGTARGTVTNISPRIIQTWQLIWNVYTCVNKVKWRWNCLNSAATFVSIHLKSNDHYRINQREKTNKIRFIIFKNDVINSLCRLTCDKSQLRSLCHVSESGVGAGAKR